MTPEDAYYQAFEIGARLPDLEPIILTSAQWANNYAHDIIKGRWEEAEPEILKYGWIAYCYAKNVLKSRWPAAESEIAKTELWSCAYSRDVIEGRFYEAEEIISKSDASIAYTNYWFKEPVVTKNQVDEFVWQRSGAKGYYEKASMFEKPFSFLDALIEASE